MRRLVLVGCLLLGALPAPAAAREPDVACVRPIPVPAPEETGLPLHQITRGGPVRVAVIDTGVAPHPLLGEVDPVADLVSPDSPDPLFDCDGHGTVVAGVIRSVAPEAQILSVRQSSAHHRDGAGTLATLAEALHAALDADAQVINVSVVSCLDPGMLLDDRPLRDALHRAESAGVVVVAAAGNAGAGCEPGMTVYPAHVEPVLAVAAVDPSDPHALADYSLPGGAVSAPGLVSAAPSPDGRGWASGIVRSGRESGFEGTSFAAPLVSGVVALLRHRHPQDSAQQLRERVLAAAEPGHGMVLPEQVVTHLLGDHDVPERDRGVGKRETVESAAPGRALTVMAGLALLAWVGLLSARFRAGRRTG